MNSDKPTISLIVAMAENRVIGRDNGLPWHLSADLKRFKTLTMGKPMLMGRNTWESLPGLLPGRQHIVITSKRDYTAEGCTIVHAIDDALQATGDAPEVMVIGGAVVYEQLLPLAQQIYLTLVHTAVNGDRFFPEYDQASWCAIEHESHPADERNPYPYTFVTLIKP